MASDQSNALAELAERLRNQYESQTSWWQDDQEGKDFEKAQRIIAELAKVKLNGVGWPVRLELADAYENCRAIAEEGANKC